MTAKVIGLINHKGGCGKTTTAVNMCGFLAEWPDKENPYHVLLIDMDPQGSANKCIGGPQTGSPKGTMVDCLLAVPPGKIPLDSCAKRSDWYDHLEYIPSYDDTMVEVQVAMMQKHINPVVVLRKLIQPVLEMYDFIIVDTGPSQGILMWNVLYAIDYVVIPTQLNGINVREVGTTLSNFERLESEFNKKPELLGILPTVYRTGVTSQDEWLSELRKKFGSYVFEPIPQNTDVPEAYDAHLPIHHYNPSAPASLCYQEFTNEVIRRAQ